MALRAIDWEPAEDSQRIPFLLAKEQFDALPALGERALQPIIKHLKHGPDGDDVSCVRVLGELANRDAIPALVEHSKQYGADKAALLLALTKLGAVDDAKELAVQCLSNSDPSVREKSAHALSGAAGDPKITTALRERLEKEDRWFVRAALKKALGAQDSEQDLDVGEALLPPFAEELVGRNEVRIRNPNDFAVTTGVRSGDRGKNFLVPAGGVASVRVPDGEYEIYFVYSSKPDALFQGDDFQLRGNGVEIRIVKVVDGNYGIRQVK